MAPPPPKANLLSAARLLHAPGFALAAAEFLGFGGGVKRPWSTVVTLAALAVLVWAAWIVGPRFFRLVETAVREVRLLWWLILPAAVALWFLWPRRRKRR